MELYQHPEALLHRLVEEHWSTITRHARRQYRERGRGAVVFRILPPGSDSNEEPLRYLTFSGSREEVQETKLAPLHLLTRTYDPSEEVVVAVQLPDNRTVFDVFEEAPATSSSS